MGKHNFFTEGKITQNLTSDKKRIWFYHLNKEQRVYLMDIFVDSEEEFNIEFEKLYEETYSNLSEKDKNKIDNLKEKNSLKAEKAELRNEKKAKQQEEYQNIVNNKVNSFLSKRGVENPSQATINLVNSSNIYANMDNFINSLGMLTTLKVEQQRQYQHYITTQDIGFLQAGQNDEIIKQNDKIIEQNDKIIELLETLTNKL